MVLQELDRSMASGLNEKPANGTASRMIKPDKKFLSTALV
jgi:hypothetical protein